MTRRGDNWSRHHALLLRALGRRFHPILLIAGFGLAGQADALLAAADEHKAPPE